MTIGRCEMGGGRVSPAPACPDLKRIGASADRQIAMRQRAPAHQRSSTSTGERARDTQQQITVLLARSALLRQ